MNVISVSAILSKAATGAVRSSASIASTVYGTLGALTKKKALGGVTNARFLADRAIAEAINYKRLRSVNLRARPLPGTSMLAQEFKSRDAYKYQLTYSYKDLEGRVRKNGYTLYSEQLLTKGNIINIAVGEVEAGMGLGFRSGIAVNESASNFQLTGAFYNDRS